MNGSSKLKSDSRAIDPADRRVERFQAVNLDPDEFVELGTINKFNFAAMR